MKNKLFTLSRKLTVVLLVVIFLVTTSCAPGGLGAIDFLVTKPTIGEVNKRIGNYKSETKGSNNTTADYDLTVCGLKGELSGITLRGIEDSVKPIAWSWSAVGDPSEEKMQVWVKKVVDYYSKKYGAYSKETINVWDAYVWKDKETGAKVYILNPTKGSRLLCVDFD